MAENVKRILVLIMLIDSDERKDGARSISKKDREKNKAENLKKVTKFVEGRNSTLTSEARISVSNHVRFRKDLRQYSSAASDFIYYNLALSFSVTGSGEADTTLMFLAELREEGIIRSIDYITY